MDFRPGSNWHKLTGSNLFTDTNNKQTTGLLSSPAVNLAYSAKARQWLTGLLISFVFIFALAADESQTPADKPKASASNEPQTLWQNVPEPTPGKNNNKWQRPDSRHNDALLKQSMSNEVSKDSGNEKQNAPRRNWQRPDSEHNDALIDEFANTRKRKSFWVDDAPPAVETAAPETPFDIEAPLLTAEPSAKTETWTDTTPIPRRFNQQGPKNLAQALLFWGGDYYQQLTFSPSALVSGIAGKTQNYYQNIRKPYIHPLAVTEDFLDMHSGPGAGYPKFYIAEHNELIYISKYQSDWYQVELRNSAGQATVKGWMPAAIINPALAAELPEQSGLNKRSKWFVGAAGGAFAGETMIQGRLGYFFSEKIWAEFAVSEVLESLSSSRLYQINLLHQPLGQQRLSPFFGIGFGYFENTPFQTTINQQDSTSNFMNVDLGIHWYLSEGFILRGDFKNYVLALDDDNFDSHQEFSAGFTVLWDSTAPRGIKLTNNEYIDRDDIELGIFVGSLALEDFATAQLSGLLLNYHFNEFMFIESRYGSADIPTNAINNFFSIFDKDSKIPLHYYSLGLGLNVFTGEAVLNNKSSIRSTAYLSAAAGSTSFLDRRLFTTHVGAGLMVTPVENWNIKFEIQNLIFEQDILGIEKQTNNLALQAGISLRF